MLQKWIAALENIVIIYGAVVHCVYNTPHQQSIAIVGGVLRGYLTELSYKAILQRCFIEIVYRAVS